MSSLVYSHSHRADLAVTLSLSASGAALYLDGSLLELRGALRERDPILGRCLFAVGYSWPDVADIAEDAEAAFVAGGER